MKWFIPLILLLLIPFHLVMINNSPVLGWDEAVYMSMGDYLASSGEIGLFEEIRPLGLPIITALVSKTTGDHIAYARTIMLLISLGVIIASMRVSKDYLGGNVAYLAGLFLAITPIFFIFSTQIMSSMLSVFFILFSYLALERQQYKRCGLFIGLAILSRFPSGMFFIFIICALLFRLKFKPILTVSLWTAIAMSPFFIINLILGNGLISPLINALSHAGNSNFAQGLLYYFPILFWQSPLLIFIPFGIWFAYKRRKYLLISSALIPLLYFSLITNKQPRFLILALPFLIMLGFHGLQFVLIKTRNGKLIAKLATLVLLVAIAFSYTGIDYYNQNFESYKPLISDLENMPGPIITTDPIPTAYVDKKIYTAYEDASIAYTSLVEHRVEASHLLYTRRSFPCHVYNNPDRCARILTWFDALAAQNTTREYVAGGVQYYLIPTNIPDQSKLN